MIFSHKSIISILIDNNFKPEITITTSKSCYKGCTYKVNAPWGNAVRIKRNDRYAYYYAGSYKLTEKTHKMFKNLSTGSTVDFFKKTIENDDIVFNHGRLFKVIKIFKDYTYLKLISRSNVDFEDWEDWDWAWDDWAGDRQFGNDGYKIESEEIKTFIKIIDPLDLLTI